MKMSIWIKMLLGRGQLFSDKPGNLIDLREELKEITEPINPLDLKSQLTLSFESEEWDFKQKSAYCLMATWRGFPLMRKGIIMHKAIYEGTIWVTIEDEDEETGEITVYRRKVPKFKRWMTPNELATQDKEADKSLLDWFKRMILNYDDLTYWQKRRLGKNEIIREDYIGPEEESEVQKYATMKRLRMREPFGKSYKLVYKTILIELK